MSSMRIIDQTDQYYDLYFKIKNKKDNNREYHPSLMHNGSAENHTNASLRGKENSTN